MEEQILRYYLKVFNIILIIFFIFCFFYINIILNTKIKTDNNIIIIEKSESIEKVLQKYPFNFDFFDIFFIKIYYKFNQILKKNYLHYGNFYLKNNLTVLELLNIISKPSNIVNKITIIEGWTREKLKKELIKHFDDYYEIPYNDILADTYYFDKNKDFDFFVKKLKRFKNNYFKKFKKNHIFNNYNQEEIMIIASLIEKEGLDYDDKKKVSSVIFNRLQNNMKLQIDATVVYAITEGLFNLDRKLLFKDLKNDNLYNTYMYKGLPPGPISYVGKNTLDIIFENYNSDFLFYFFDYSLNRHIFSKTFDEHKKKLNEYRSK